MGHFLFGMNLEGFSTIGRCFYLHSTYCFGIFCEIQSRFCVKRPFRALVECLKMAMGEIGIFPDMVNAAPGIANLFFVSFVFIVVQFPYLLLFFQVQLIHFRFIKLTT
jgi:hypothetical protein